MCDIIRYPKFVYTITLSLSIVYFNDVWTVEDVWNSQNIPISKQESGEVLSCMVGKSDRRLQVQNNILSQQLTESQQARNDTEKLLQDVIESYQQEICSLQETQSQLKETQLQLQLVQKNFQDSRQQTQVFVSVIFLIIICM